MLKIYATYLLFFVFYSLTCFASNEDSKNSLKEEVFKLPVEDLVQVPVSTSSKRLEAFYDAPGVMSVMTRAEIELFGANDLTELLARFTSVLPAYDLFINTTLPVRGDTHSTGNDAHVLILLNGDPINRDSYGGFWNQAIYSSLPIAAIDRIELIRGPGSVLYGTNAYTGVVNIITNKKKENLVTVSPKYGTFSTSWLEALQNYSSSDSEFSTSTSLKFSTTDGRPVHFIGKEGPPAAGFPDPISFNLYQRGSWGIMNQTKLGNLGVSAALLRTTQHTQQTFRSGFPSEINNNKYFGGLNYQHKLTKNWNITYSITDVIGYTELDYSSVQLPQPYPQWGEYKTHDTTLAITSLNTIGKDLHFLTGTQFTHIHGNVDPKYPRRNPLTDTPIPTAWSQWWMMIYAQADYRINPYLKLIAGAQLNKVPYYDPYYIPRGGAIVNFTPNLGIRALYGEAFRAPLANEAFGSPSAFITSNPNLKPEFIKTLDLQVFYNQPAFQIDLTYFHSVENDLIIRSFRTTPGIYLNATEQTLQGLELETKWIPSRNIYLTGSVTLQYSKNAAGSANSALAPTLISKTGVGYTGSQYSVGLFNSLVTAYHTFSLFSDSSGNPYNPVPEAFDLLSANFTVNLSSFFSGLPSYLSDIRFSLYGTNLFNTDFWIPTAFDPNSASTPTPTVPGGPGRALYASLQARL